MVIFQNDKSEIAQAMARQEKNCNRIKTSISEKCILDFKADDGLFLVLNTYIY